MPALQLPGYRVLDGERPAPESGLRNDVAAFLGPTDRGPLGTPVRVTGRLAYAAVFGRQRRDLATPRAVAAYFANEGEVAWVVRAGSGGACSAGELELGTVIGGRWGADAPRRLTLPGNRLTLRASSPGTWADGTAVTIDYRAFGAAGAPELDVRIAVPGEPVFQRTALAEDELIAAIEASGLVTAQLGGRPVSGQRDGATFGPSHRRWELTLESGTEPAIGPAEYRQAVLAQAEVEEVALVCAPGAEARLAPADVDALVADLASSAAASQDRLAIVSVPELEATAVADWRRRMAAAVTHAHEQRAIAAYGPYLLAEELARGGLDPYPPTDPVGHVCGVISRLDRERGSGWNPANALVSDAVDVAAPATEGDQAFALSHELNLLRCRPGGGLEVWGARTLDRGDGRHVGHRRIVHRIVRAVRRVAEPLVFDTNGPLLWFAVVRAVSSVLLEAFRTGALKGDTPDQAYRVRCDETTNPPEAIESGLVVCEIELAPATPMEFITLRLTLGAQGLLEVVEQ